MADKTMPPNDPMEGAPAMPGEMGATAPMPEAPAQGGDVMISMPKSAFDAMQQIVQSLAQGLQQLAQDIEGQAKGGGGAPSPEGAMEAEKEAAAPGGAPKSEDEEFLKSMMEEGNAKTK
jgi:hypothetical protein